jgi:CO/xanthine dehydrogenase FAD-binding subunit
MESFALPVEERRTETAVRPDEIFLPVPVPLLPNGTRSTQLKAMDGKVWAFALVGAAAVLRVGSKANRRINEAHLVRSGVAPIPWRAVAAEGELIGAEVYEALCTHAAEAALAVAVPLRQHADKLPLAKPFIQRARALLTREAMAGN